LPGDASLGQVVDAVHAIPYGRPGSRTAEGVIDEWKGTCSTKHALLARLLRERWPESRPRLVHRVYRVSRGSALRRYGGVAAGAVPEGGLTDVHRYLVIVLAGQEVRIDVTFPGAQAWDGRPAGTACERPHKALPRKRHGAARETTIEAGALSSCRSVRPLRVS